MKRKIFHSALLLLICSAVSAQDMYETLEAELAKQPQVTLCTSGVYNQWDMRPKWDGKELPALLATKLSSGTTDMAVKQSNGLTLDVVVNCKGQVGSYHIMQQQYTANELAALRFVLKALSEVPATQPVLDAYGQPVDVSVTLHFSFGPEGKIRVR